jgi:hypothetical protein
LTHSWHSRRLGCLTLAMAVMWTQLLHRDNRYDRTADGVERVTGIPPQSIEAFVAARRDIYLG